MEEWGERCAKAESIQLTVQITDVRGKKKKKKKRR